MKIKLRLTPESIDNAIAELKKYSINLQDKANEIARELAYLGRNVVDTHYAQSHELYVLYVDVVENTAMVIAVGDNVVFLEFGTGVYADDHTEGMETEGLPPIYGGAWSQSEGMGHFRPDHQYWYYEGIKYQGTLPMQGFYFASKEIQNRAVEIARQVFKK